MRRLWAKSWREMDADERQVVGGALMVLVGVGLVCILVPWVLLATRKGPDVPAHGGASQGHAVDAGVQWTWAGESALAWTTSGAYTFVTPTGLYVLEGKAPDGGVTWTVRGCDNEGVTCEGWRCR